tara:strand:- start:1570 stop:2226 length:657 start_codon:yes stop_codon:yes gene_type:complete
MLGQLLSVKLQNDALKQLEKALADSPKEIGKRTERAINKTAAKHKTQIAKKLREFVKVKAKVAKEHIDIPQKALAPNRLSSMVQVNQSKRIGLNRFGAKQNKKGVRYQISKTEKGFIKSGFIIQRLGGHVFERANKYVPAQPIPKKASKDVRDAIRIKNKAQRKLNRQITTPRRGTSMYNVYKRNKLEKWSKKTIAKELRFQIEQQVKYVLEKKAKNK